jgi:predicted dehydrogenase
VTFTAGVVGLGYWGPNLARNLASHPQFRLTALCDADRTRLDRHGAFYPAARCFTSLQELLATARPDLLAIATPVASHHRLAKEALEAGCHVLVEKPLARTSAEADELVQLAARRERHLFVDHTFLFTGAVAEIRKQVASGALGDLLYVDSVRISLGLFQPDVDVVWDLAPHDLAILNYVVGRRLVSVRALGSSHNPRGTADVAYLHLDYEGGIGAHLHLSWLSPVKVRRMILAGRRQSLIYDDLEPAEKVKIYDHGVAFDYNDPETQRQVLVSYRKGDMRAPALSVSEALSTEMDEIAQVLDGRASSRAGGTEGRAVMQALEAADRSLKAGGAAVSLDG